MEATHKVAVVGAPGVGKTSLYAKFQFNHFCEDGDYLITDHDWKVLQHNQQNQILHLSDVKRNEVEEASGKQMIRSSEAIALIYSVSSKLSLQAAEDLVPIIRTIKDSDDYIPLVLVGNKCDLHEEREVSFAEGEQLAKSLNCPFHETSAKQDTNVEVMFLSLLTEILNEETKREGKKMRDRNNRNSAKKECIIN